MVTETVSTTFAVIPAIDLRGGRVVRLRQGDFEREDVFADDPAAVATTFAAGGAAWIHVVDLDGARSGSPVNGAAVQAITECVATTAGATRIEVAGGLRSTADVDGVLSRGADRAVLGTAILADPDLARRLVDRHGPDRIVAAIDVRDGLAVGEGWRAVAAGVTPETVLPGLQASGIRAFEVTAIDRDGLLGGPDLDLLRRLVALRAGDVIASGGVRSIDDLRAIRDVGCRGAIVGRALYEGRLDLVEAIAALA